MRGREYLIGIDEVGRGPLAGPLCVGACLIRARERRRVYEYVRGVRDCKHLSGAQRVAWLERIQDLAARGYLMLATALVGHAVIDRCGLGAALGVAIGRSLRRLPVRPERAEVLLDGGIAAPQSYPFQRTIIRGDETVPLIALASIAAKVRRDRHMVRLARRFPEYGFEKHKGYGTKAHYRALREYGPCPVHRVSFLRGFIAAVDAP